MFNKYAIDCFLFRKAYSANLNYGRLVKRRRPIKRLTKKTVRPRNIESEELQTEILLPIIEDQPTTAVEEDEFSDFHEEDAWEEEKANMCSDTTVELLATHIQGVLSASGADQHFTLNKDVKIDHFRSMLRRACKYFAYSLLKMNWYFVEDVISIDTVLKVVYDDNNYILEYCTHMLVPKVKSATIKSTICDILSISKWLHLFAKTKALKKRGHKWEMYAQVIAAARNIYASKEAKSKYDNVVSIEEKIQSGQFPQNGMQGLQDLANKLIPKALAIAESSLKTNLDLTRGIFKEFMGILLLVFYAFIAQGRVCGIVSLKKKQIKEIREKGHALSTEFKTQKYHHYQPVPLPSQGETLFDNYLTIVRPQAVARSSRPQDDPDNYIFLNFDGKKYTNIGQEVASITRDVSIQNSDTISELKLKFT